MQRDFQERGKSPKNRTLFFFPKCENIGNFS
nr:MAG TPA: hypothetical protein [Caudoviricetes sp.]